MALVTTKQLMLDAQKNHYAIGAFNAENMEMVQAIIAAAEEMHAPVIVQTTPGTLKYASPSTFHAMAGCRSCCRGFSSGCHPSRSRQQLRAGHAGVPCRIYLGYD